MKITTFQSESSELYQALEKITDHHIKDGLVGLMSVATDYYRYCAYELYNAMDVSSRFFNILLVNFKMGSVLFIVILHQ